MIAFTKISNWGLLLLKYSVCLLAFAAHAASAKQQSVAIFQFTATSMDVVGIENDVAYVVRNELRKNPGLTLLNQREMEVTLMRNRIIQSFELEQAVNAGVALDVNFVVIGSVSRKNGAIVSDLALVATASKQQIANWSFSFINQQDVLNRGKEIGVAIDEAIQSYIGAVADGASQSESTNWLANISAELVNGQIHLKWQAESFAPESLGFNVFRGLSKQGPFSYVTSVLDPEYIDDLQGLGGNVYYQISLLNALGEEFRSNKIATVLIAVEAVSDIAPPAILSVAQLIKGVEVEFLPSAQNAQQNISEYQLVRRQNGQAWTVVNTINVGAIDTQAGNKKNENIKQYKIVDLQSDSIVGPVEYAVRAVSGQELGNASTVYSHTPVTPPQLVDTGVVGIRQTLLKWQAVSSGKGYHLYKRDAEGKHEWQRIATLDDISQTEYIDTDIAEDGRAFQYAMSVFDLYSSSSLGPTITLASRGPLPAPADVKLTSGLARKVIINWQPYVDEGLKGYAIFRADYSEETNISLLKVGEVTDPLAASYTDTSFEGDGKHFYYAVAAMNVFGASGDLSPVIKAETKPAPKSILTIDGLVEPEGIQLTWTPDPQQVASAYMLERRWQKSQWETLVEVNAQTLNYEDKQLLPQGSVEYRVSVVDNDGLISSPISTSGLMAPNQVQFIPQPDGLLRRVNLAWQPIPIVDALHVLRRSGQEQWLTVAELPGSAAQFIDNSGLVDDQQYDYKLKLFYLGNAVTESELISMKTKDIPAPSELVADSGQARKLVLTWATTNDPDLKSTMLYRASDIDNFTSFKFVAEIPVTEPSTYTDSTDNGGIQHGKVYRYAIASRNVFDVVGPIGASIEGHTKSLPSSVSDFSVTPNENNIQLSWQTGPESDLKTAQIYRRWKHETSWSLLTEIAASKTTYEDSALLPFAAVEYKVSLLDQDNLPSKDSDILSVKSPLTITLVASQQELLRKSTMQWTENKHVESYTVQRSENNVTWQDISSSPQNSYVDEKNLLDEKNYFYQVLAFHNRQKLGQSNIIEIKTKQLPRPPENFVAQSGQVKKVSLSWTPYTDIDVGGYIVYRVEKDGKLDELSKLKNNESSYVDEGSFFSSLDHGKYYEYRISAFNRFKVEGPKSESINASTKSLPSMVSGLSVKNENDFVELNWQTNNESDIREYQIYRGKSCGRGNKLTSVNSQTTHYTDSSVEADNDYCYYIIAVDADSLESKPSDNVSVTIGPK